MSDKKQIISKIVTGKRSIESYNINKNVNHPVPESVGIQAPAVDQPILTMTKTATPSVIGPNGVVTFTIQIQNTGTAPATNIQITDTTDLPGTFTTFAPIFKPVPGGLQGTIASLNNQSTINFIFTFTVSATAADGIYTNTGLITADQSGPILSTAEIQVRSTIATNFVVGTTVDNSNPKPGDKIHYTIRIRNIGAADINLLQLTNISNVPGKFISVPPGFTITDSGKGFTGRLTQPLRPGEVRAADVIFQVDETAKVGTYTDSLTVSAGPVTKKANVTINVTEASDTTNLEVTKTPNRRLINPGDEVIYTINIRNIGEHIAKNVTIEDFNFLQGVFTCVPCGLSILGNSFSGSLDDIEPNEKISLKVKFKSNNNVPDASYGNLVTVKISNGEQDQYAASGVVEVRRNLSAIRITKTANKTNIAPGEIIDFTIIVSNAGTVPLTNIDITDSTTLPGTFTAVPEGFVITPTGIRGTINRLEPGNSATLVISFRSSANTTIGLYTNLVKALVRNSCLSDETAIAIAVVAQSTDLSIEKTATALSRGLVRSTITIKNNTNNRVENIELVDQSTYKAPFTNIPQGFTVTPNGFLGLISLNAGQTLVLNADQTPGIGTQGGVFVNTVLARHNGIENFAAAPFRVQLV